MEEVNVCVCNKDISDAMFKCDQCKTKYCRPCTIVMFHQHSMTFVPLSEKEIKAYEEHLARESSDNFR